MKHPIFGSKVFWERLVSTQVALAQRLNVKDESLSDDDIQLLNAIIRRIHSDTQEFLQVIHFLDKKYDSKVNPPTPSEKSLTKERETIKPSSSGGFTYMLKNYESQKDQSQLRFTKPTESKNDKFFKTE